MDALHLPKYSDVCSELGMSDENSKFQAELRKTVNKLDSVSPSFCMAKWLQVTLHLHSGQNHSCHHPVAHDIDTKGLKQDPSRLHNTEFKMLQRKEMLEGRRPAECDYCWKIEDAAKGNVSDRHFKSHDYWAKPQIDQIAKLPWNAPVSPTYLEVSFSNACNFKCAYCQPFASNQWMNEILDKGGYHLAKGTWLNKDYVVELNKKIRTEDENPFVDAFWNWWPDLSKTLKVFRITGGEPLLSANTAKVIDYFQSEPRPELEFYINSNLGMRTSIVEKTAKKLRPLVEGKHVKSFGLYTSLDTWGAPAEYLRDGLDLEQFVENFDHFLSEVSPIKITFMVTFNLLSLTNFTELLKFALDRRKLIREKLKNGNEVFVDISYLRDPPFLAVNLATPELIQKAEEIAAFMHAHSVEKQVDGFYFFEIEKMDRLVKWMKTEHPAKKVELLRADLYAYVNEYDKRRKKDFLKVFPELTELYLLGKKTYEEVRTKGPTK